MCTTRCPPSAAHHFATMTSRVASLPAVSRHAACQSVTRIASVSMYASAALSATTWNVDSGRPNWWRSEVYSAAMRSAPSATPTCSAHNPTSARSSIHAVAFRPSISSSPTRFSPRCSAGTPAKARCATLARSVVAGTGGIDDEDAQLVVACCRRHEHPVGDVSGRHAGFHAIEPPGVAVAGGGRVRTQWVVHALLRERGGEDHFAVRNAGKPSLPLLRGPEFRQRERAEYERRPHGHRRDPASLLLEQQGELDEPEPAAPVLLGHGQREQ